MESLTRQALMLALRPELGSQRARCLFVPGGGLSFIVLWVYDMGISVQENDQT